MPSQSPFTEKQFELLSRMQLDPLREIDMLMACMMLMEHGGLEPTVGDSVEEVTKPD